LVEDGHGQQFRRVRPDAQPCLAVLSEKIKAIAFTGGSIFEPAGSGRRFEKWLQTGGTHCDAVPILKAVVFNHAEQL
jgi:hypothetical protein